MKIKQVIVILLLSPSILWGQVVVDTAKKQNNEVADSVMVVQLPSLSTDYYSSLILERNYDYPIYIYTLLGDANLLYYGSLIAGIGFGGLVSCIGLLCKWHWATIVGASLGVVSIFVVPSFIIWKKMKKQSKQLRMESLDLSLVHYELRNYSLIATPHTCNSNSLSNLNLGISVSLHF